MKVEKAYLLVQCAQIPKNVDIISEKGYDIDVQNKGKRNKVKVINSFCTEPDQAGSMQEENKTAIITLPLNNKSEYSIFVEEVKQWEELFPSVEVVQQLRNMKAWLLSNPRKQKTKQGINQFITHWLSDKQDRLTIAKTETGVKKN